MPFSRFDLLFGQDASSTLAQKRVVVVGIGGVGSPVIECLVRSGIGKLTVVDQDVIEVSNCNRQLMADSTNIGMYKVEAMAKHLLAVNPQLQIVTHCTKITKDNVATVLTDDYDYIIDAIDDVSAKVALVSLANAKGMPIICATGFGQRFDPTKVKITNLNQTSNDPLARALRQQLKARGMSLGVMVACSTELPKPVSAGTIGSYISVTLTAGALIADYVIKSLLK